MDFRILQSRDFRYTALNQLWRLVSGPLLLLAIPLYLSLNEQGYWYTFVSLAALAVFADLGFSSVLMLFSSHEFAHLEFEDSSELKGDSVHLERLATLWVFSLKWSITMAFLVFPLVLTGGFYLLNQHSSVISWGYPWLIYGIASIFVFINSVLLSFVEGCNSVGNVHRIRLKVGLVSVLSTILFLIMGFGLYALTCSLVLSALTGSVLLIKKYRKTFIQLYKVAQGGHHRWFSEIMPLLWRYSVSWASGYFILSLFAPVAFKYYTPVDAGRAGLSVAICTAIFGIANVWITVITPKINIHVAREEYALLDHVFFRHLFLAAGTYLIAVVTLFVGIRCVGEYSSFTSRIVSPISFMFLALGWFFQLLINAFAVYMRASKLEPLMFPSVLNGLYVGLGTLLISLYLPFELFFLGFFTAYLWVLPWVVYLFVQQRQSRIIYAP